MSFHLVIFDNDGVLVDSEPIANAVLARTLADSGVELTVTECIERYLGGTLQRVRSDMAKRLGIDLPPSFESRYHRLLFERFRTELHPMPGVCAVLDQLDALKLPYCVASSGTIDRITLALTVTGLLPRFAGRIFSAEQVAHGKPAPDLFLLAARQMHVETNACAVIEDSPLGIAAANAAGMISFGFTDGTDPARLAGATGGVFRDMRDLPELLLRATR